MCLYTWLWNIACLGGTGCLWSLYLFPTLFYPYCRTRMLPLAAAITMGEHQPMGDISQGGSSIDVRGCSLWVLSEQYCLPMRLLLPSVLLLPPLPRLTVIIANLPP